MNKNTISPITFAVFLCAGFFFSSNQAYAYFNHSQVIKYPYTSQESNSLGLYSKTLYFDESKTLIRENSCHKKNKKTDTYRLVVKLQKSRVQKGFRGRQLIIFSTDVDSPKGKDFRRLKNGSDYSVGNNGYITFAKIPGDNTKRKFYIYDDGLFNMPVQVKYLPQVSTQAYISCAIDKSKEIGVRANFFRDNKGNKIQSFFANFSDSGKKNSFERFVSELEIKEYVKKNRDTLLYAAKYSAKVDLKAFSNPSGASLLNPMGLVFSEHRNDNRGISQSYFLLDQKEGESYKRELVRYSRDGLYTPLNNKARSNIITICAGGGCDILNTQTGEIMEGSHDDGLSTGINSQGWAIVEVDGNEIARIGVRGLKPLDAESEPGSSGDGSSPGTGDSAGQPQVLTFESGSLRNLSGELYLFQ